MNPGDSEYYKMSGEVLNYHIIEVLISQQFILKGWPEEVW